MGNALKCFSFNAALFAVLKISIQFGFIIEKFVVFEGL